MVVSAVIHNPCNIEMEHGAANGDQTSPKTIYNESDDTLMEENAAASQHKMVVKKDYGSKQAAGAESGSYPNTSTGAAAAAGESSSLDVEKGQSPTKVRSPFRQKITNITKGISTRARWVTERLSILPHHFYLSLLFEGLYSINYY